ncbi:sigma-70 region 4 domain-containing protein [Luteimonas suaedae]|uniref:sigma-70 region 4 domain-containing protein n=1 Tax=Luteimonas suaedae TaxID=2605430 RepID=UPI0011EEFDFE|nr:sigma-70 region 4 domain-containing protein [Luteimonas suaedae]
MTARTVNDAAAASAALTAFLRGVERRAAVFAQLQIGDAEAGDTALSAAMGAFRDVAVRVPFGDWPRRFWALLLSAGPMHEPPPAPAWPPQFHDLAQAGYGPRAALLLRLVANVSEADAAAVLGVTRATYRLALQRALPRDADGRADAEAWRALGEASQQAVRQLPPTRLAELARLREAALQGRVHVPHAAQAHDDRSVRARAPWVWPATVAVVVLTLAALAATVEWPLSSPNRNGDLREILAEPLPPARAPAATYDADAALLTHPDFELLASDGGDAAMRDPAFHAWLSVQLERGEEGDIARPQREETEADVDESSLETDDAL